MLLEERFSLSSSVSKVDDRVFNELLEKVGSNGRYQLIMLSIMFIANYISGGLYCIIPFLFHTDPYVCPPDTPLADQSCREYVCSLPPQQRESFIPEPSMHTLGNQFGDYRCNSEQLYLSVVQTLLYTGRIGGSLLLTMVGDYFTRRTFFMISWYFSLIGLIMINFSSGLIQAGFWLFIGSIGAGNLIFIGYYFCIQQVGESRRQEYMVLVQIFFGVGVALNPLWYYLTKDWRLVFGYFYVLPIAIVIILCWLYLVDTPICLVTRYSAQTAYSNFMVMARLNGQNPQDISVESIQRLQDKYRKMLEENRQRAQDKFTVKDLFKYPSLRKLTIVVTLSVCIGMFLFFASILLIDKFKLNLYINGAVNGISQTLSYPFSFYLISRVARKTVQHATFVTLFACSTFLLFVWDQNQDSDAPTPLISQSLGLFALIFIFRYASSVQGAVYMVYQNQVFPTQVRVLGTSLATLVAGILLTITPQILTIFLQLGIPIMLLFAIFSLIGVYLITLHPETLGVPPRQIIEELAQKRNGIQLQNVQQYHTSDYGVVSQSYK